MCHSDIQLKEVSLANQWRGNLHLIVDLVGEIVRVGTARRCLGCQLALGENAVPCQPVLNQAERDDGGRGDSHSGVAGGWVKAEWGGGLVCQDVHHWHHRQRPLGSVIAGEGDGDSGAGLPLWNSRFVLQTIWVSKQILTKSRIVKVKLYWAGCWGGDRESHIHAIAGVGVGVVAGDRNRWVVINDFSRGIRSRPSQNSGGDGAGIAIHLIIHNDEAEGGGIGIGCHRHADSGVAIRQWQ